MASQSHRPRVVVTRTREQSTALADQLRRAGADPLLLPLIAVSPPDSSAALDEALARLHSFEWLVFTSSNAVEATLDRAALLGIDLEQQIRNLRVAAIGSATARALAARGLVCALTAPEAVSESLAGALVPFAIMDGSGQARFLLPRAQDARSVLPEVLKRAGADVEVVAAYRNVLPVDARDAVRSLFIGDEPLPDAIAFTSSSTVRNLFVLLEEMDLRLPDSVLRASIGPVTSATLREAGHPAHVEAGVTSVASLASAVVDALRSRRP